MKSYESILEEKNIRITAMRQIILEFFLKENKVIGLSSLETIFPRADRITMFRTLKMFVEKGILHQIDAGTSEAKYGLCKEHCSTNQHKDLHPHFHCSRCGQIECLETVFIPDLQLPQGYEPQEVSMAIKGICNRCS